MLFLSLRTAKPLDSFLCRKGEVRSGPLRPVATDRLVPTRVTLGDYLNETPGGSTPIVTHNSATLNPRNTRGISLRKTKIERRLEYGARSFFERKRPHWFDPEPSTCRCCRVNPAECRKFEKTKGKDGQHPKDDACRRQYVLRRKAKKIVRLLEVDQSLKSLPQAKIPKSVCCGSLRSVVRSMFPPELTLVQELSIKTSANAEVQPCDFCENLQKLPLVDAYEKARYRPVDVDKDHLERFAKALAQNIPDGWNLRSKNFPYIPNGGASLEHSRSEGGNWNDSEFSAHCGIVPVFTKGKWRIVTKYSSHNVSVLSPLHDSLYASLSRRNWLLVGSPTDERLRYLQAGCKGTEWLSFDYKAATDNIKTAYVQRAVDLLIDKGEGLTNDEVRCLRVVAELSFGGPPGITRGQPMGSPISFPLLCLINKTVVDLALTDLLIKGKIPFKEWTGHRCLINGDDLLTMSTSSGSLAEAIFENGSQVGLESNWEKTLASPEYGEINSTVFKNCVRQKKTNVSALWMSAEVTDVLGYAHESCTSVKGFLEVTRNNVSRLARQKIKTFGHLPFSFKEALLSQRQVKKALSSRPCSEQPKETNLFPVVSMPDGYDLSRQEEIELTRERVRAIREKGLFADLAAERKANRKKRKNIGTVVDEKKRKRSGFLGLLKPHRPDGELKTLEIFASYWQNKRKEELLAVEGDISYTEIVSDLNRVEAMLDEIGTFKVQRKNSAERPIPNQPTGCPFSEGNGYVSLTDDH